MFKKIKEYSEYRKNKKIAKREFVRLAASALPVIREIAGKGTEIVKFLAALTEESKNTDNETAPPS